MRCALQLHDVFSIDDALAILWKAVSKHIGDQSNVYLFTNGAQRLRWLPNVLGGTNQFGVCITDRVFAHASTFHFIDECASRQLMVDNSRTTAQHINGETHDYTR